MTVHADTVTTVRTEYAFSNRAPEAVDQLATLESYLDPLTKACLQDIGPHSGDRCLEIGPGRGSIAYWLTEQVGPTGRVVAVDQDTSRLVPTPGLEMIERDIRRGIPADGPFDLIHARLVLLHLPERRRLLRELADRLAPGGWLVLGEFSRAPLAVLTADSQSEAGLFTRVIETLVRVLEQGHGADLGWAHEVHSAMAGLGLERVHSVEHAEAWTGGGPGCYLHHVNSVQKHEALRQAGLTDAELDEFRRIVADPGFSARSWQFVCTRGQRP